MDPETAVSIDVPTESYWRLRTRLLEHQALLADCERRATASQVALNALLESLGLDPSIRYTLDDDAQTATASSG